MTHPIQIADIDHVVLRVSDLSLMLTFYSEILGCEPVRRNEELGLIHLRAGRSLIDLITIDGPLGKKGGQGPGFEGRNLDHFCLRVADFDPMGIVAFLREKGVRVDDPAERFGADGHGLSIYLNDPENNTVELRAHQ